MKSRGGYSRDECFFFEWYIAGMNVEVESLPIQDVCRNWINHK